MREKKSNKKNLEKKKFLFLEIGFIITLAIIVSAFEYANPEESNNVFGELRFDNTEIDFIPITRPEPPEPELPEIKEQIPTVINIKDNNDTDTDSITINSDIDEKKKIDPKIKYFDNNTEPPEETKPLPIGAVEFKPEFPGGDAALLKFINKNTNYPAYAKNEGIQGKVYIQFIITKEGKVSNVEILRPIDQDLDAEALRVIKMLPDWKPGYQGVNPVDCIFIIPINFILSN